ncbi:hypothetical protein BDV96DRAFT_667202 [Lophiotrema nucula]|uniref:Short-chain dehydrogenase n=1 Tax=Lophiotrema nucula TaxID=690887 RepID=A0A6A5YSX6_9PLEO|nr:hypothetical protein BDV96DRAFT_667202 [Lophiotrema nucula]
MPLAGVGFGALWTQCFPPPALITEKNLLTQTGKVFIVTGGSSGLGFELAKILYAAGGKVYILSRTKQHVDDAILNIKRDVGTDGPELGILEFIQMDLEDLTSVQAAAREFVRKEKRLDVLFNNAGLASVPGKKTKQGLEYHIGVNSVAHILLETLLKPLLTDTAKLSRPDSVRVVWPASMLCETLAPKGGIRISKLDAPDENINEHYAESKVGNWFAASEISRRFGRQTGVISIAGNPGSYSTNVWRTTPRIFYWPFLPLLRKPSACTYLWMAFSDDVTMSEAVTGRYATCDGRWHPGQRSDLLLALKMKEEGGTVSFYYLYIVIEIYIYLGDFNKFISSNNISIL